MIAAIPLASLAVLRFFGSVYATVPRVLRLRRRRGPRRVGKIAGGMFLSMTRNAKKDSVRMIQRFLGIVIHTHDMVYVSSAPATAIFLTAISRAGSNLYEEHLIFLCLVEETPKRIPTLEELRAGHGSLLQSTQALNEDLRILSFWHEARKEVMVSSLRVMDQ